MTSLVSKRRSQTLAQAVAAFALAFFATGAHAQTTTAAQAPAGPSLFPLILTLIFVLALIPVAVWMLKRLGTGSVAGAGGMRVVAQLSLGQRERLVVVEAGERWLVLGVTPSAINRVGTLPKGELPDAPAAGTAFASLLKHARNGRENG